MGKILTPALRDTIVQYILAGGFAGIAAEAAGVSPRLFRAWMRKGREGEPLYAELYEAIKNAEAQSRLKAEIDTRAKDTRFWLKHGPGREVPGRRGWTNPAKPTTGRRSAPRLFELPEVQQLLVVIMEALADFPEARAAVGKRLAELEKTKISHPESGAREGRASRAD